MKHAWSGHTLLLLVSMRCLSLFSQPGSAMIRIDLYHESLVSSLLVSPVSGVHSSVPCLEGSGRLPGGHYYLTVYRDRLLVVGPGAAGRLLDSLFIEPVSEDAVLALRPVNPYLPRRLYNGSISIRPRDGYLSIINTLDLDSYLAGVAEAEAGPGAPAEFYKAQIILCRTYAIRNLQRHSTSGANLCDGVHCQVFHGLPVWNRELLDIASATGGMILVSPDSVPVHAAYHANSGGYTRNSGEVWLKDLPYLRACRDTFSLGGRNARWTRGVGFGEWISYLESKKFDLPPVISGRELGFSSRVPARYYVVRDDSMSFADIRNDWDFPSGFFDIRYEGGSFRFEGRGYGHGLGMSQEGAMNMAARGYNYKEILNFYFKGTFILDYRVSKEW